MTNQIEILSFRAGLKGKFLFDARQKEECEVRFFTEPEDKIGKVIGCTRFLGIMETGILGVMTAGAMPNHRAVERHRALLYSSAIDQGGCEGEMDKALNIGIQIGIELRYHRSGRYTMTRK